MNIQEQAHGRRVRDLSLALFWAVLLAAGVMLALARISPAPSRTEGTGAIDIRARVLYGDWMRRNTARFAGPHAEMQAMPERQAPADLALVQRRLVASIVARHRVGDAHAATVVSVAWRVADELRIDPLLVLAVIAVESGFDATAQSQQGAQGLMQIHTDVHAERFEPYGGSAAVFDPQANIRVGAELLRMHLIREGSTERALKAYVGAANRSHDSGYGARVLRARDLFREVVDAQDRLVVRTGGQGMSRLASGS